MRKTSSQSNLIAVIKTIILLFLNEQRIHLARDMAGTCVLCTTNGSPHTFKWLLCKTTTPIPLLCWSFFSVAALFIFYFLYFICLFSGNWHAFTVCVRWAVNNNDKCLVKLSDHIYRFYCTTIVKRMATTTTTRQQQIAYDIHLWWATDWGTHFATLQTNGEAARECDEVARSDEWGERGLWGNAVKYCVNDLVNIIILLIFIYFFLFFPCRPALDLWHTSTFAKRMRGGDGVCTNKMDWAHAMAYMPWREMIK